MDTVKLLTDIIKSEVCGAPLSVAPLTEEEARELFALAKRHSLAHIVGDALCRAGLLPHGEAKAAFEKEAFAAICRYELMKKELESLCALFEEEKIPYIPLKGSVLRDYYPSPWMRNSCDIDILVKPEDHDRAKELLIEKGYRLFIEYTHDTSFDSPLNVHIELHFCLLEKNVLPLAASFLDDPWVYATPIHEKSFRYAFSDEAFYLYHTAHMAKHYLQGGCGMRAFLDLWILEHKLTYDTDKRARMLEKCGLLQFSAAARMLTEVWFGEEAKTRLTQEMEAFVLAGGVYGTEKNRSSVQVSKRGGKIRHGLFLIFLPYRILKFSYPILKKHKWLYPFCQIHRWFKRLFSGHLKRVTHTVFMLDVKDSKDTRQGTRTHLEELGF